MADESAFCGTWKIVECVSLAGTVEPTGIEGTYFSDEATSISSHTWWQGVVACGVDSAFADLAGRLVTSPASSASFERIFGTFSLIHYKIRSRLGVPCVQKESNLVFCYCMLHAEISTMVRRTPTGQFGESMLGTEFHLDESGDVSWKVSEDAESMPFFACETYEVSLCEPAALKFFGAFAGHIIEFRVEVSDDLMLLTYERCCMLQCQKISSSDPKDEIPFSFLGALDEGFFSDLVIKDENGKEFKVHKTLLSLAVPEVDWSQSPAPLSGLPQDVLHTILHYLYAECLPSGLSEDTARACIKAVHKMAGFSKFTGLCETFLKNTALRQQITSLVNDMHTCADKIIDLFSGKITGNEPPSSSEESLMANPAKLCYVVKQALREAAVAGAKLLILCDLFSRRKGELSREERHEIIKYAKSRLPVFMNQLHKFLEVCKQHSASLTASQRHEIATYLVPEIETTLDTISTFVVETKTALEQVISSSNTPDKHDKDKHKKGHVGDVLGKTLKNALHMRELVKLKAFHEKTTQSFMNLMQKKENFGMMSQEEKIRSVSKNLEQLIDEVPLFLVRIEELMSALDEKVTWREWKYLFKLGTSKVAWALSKVQTHRPTLQSMITQSCTMVHRDQFVQSLMTLGLVDPPATATDGASAGPAKPPQTTKYAQLSSVESLCKPPYPRDSKMAMKTLELLGKGLNTDMVFEIIIVQESGDVVIDHTHGEPINRTDHQKEVDLHQIPAHCVIIAARCDWFRRALLSGMRESIDKKITVHDTNPELFRLLLEYLYSGQLETNELSTEQLADMMALSDRYEMDCVKSLCEHALKHHLDEDSALFLLSLADQFHARSLRSAALTFVMEHPGVVESDIFEDLPHHLQTEVENAVAWHGLEPRGRNMSGHSHIETPSSMSSVSEVDELMSALELGDRVGILNDPSTSSSSEEIQCHFMEDSARLEACLSALRDIVGEAVPREELVRVALAADYDTNRALNFFFSS